MKVPTDFNPIQNANTSFGTLRIQSLAHKSEIKLSFPS